MAMAAIFKNKKNGHISGTIWPVSVNFGIMTHIGPPK